MPANCGVATVFRATQVSPLRFGMFVRDIAADGPVGRVVWMCHCDGRRAVMDVGAPFMTPGAGTAQPVRGIVRGGVRGVSGQLRRCVGLPGDTSVAPTFWRRHPAPLRRPAGGDGRRGAIYDARCRNGTPRPRHCAMRCARRFRPIAALRRSSGRHKCRPYVWRRHSAALRRLFAR